MFITTLHQYYSKYDKYKTTRKRQQKTTVCHIHAKSLSQQTRGPFHPGKQKTNFWVLIKQ